MRNPLDQPKYREQMKLVAMMLDGKINGATVENSSRIRLTPQMKGFNKAVRALTTAGWVCIEPVSILWEWPHQEKWVNPTPDPVSGQNKIR